MKKVFLVTRDGVVDGDPLLQSMQTRFELVENPDEAELILVIGGDGTMLDAIRKHLGFGKPFLGLNRGHIGFLMNNPDESVLDEIVQGQLKFIELKLLGAELRAADGEFVGSVTAFNDFYIERASAQTANIRVTVNGQVHFDPLICDGIIVSSPAGSTAYNAAASGSILPLDSRAMVLTGICPAIFHHWRTGVLSESSVITLEALDIEKRPVRFLADGVEPPCPVQPTKAIVRFSNTGVKLGFANSQDFRKKVTALQFGQN